MLQTMWDSIQQIIRILLYAGAGALVTAGIIDQATGVALAGAVLGVINGVWTWYWNRKAVTVKGLEAAGKATAAVAVENAVKAVKKAAKP
jgi:hypothetical protein